MAISIEDLLRQIQQEDYMTPGGGIGGGEIERRNRQAQEVIPEGIGTEDIVSYGIQPNSAPIAPISPDDLVPRSLGNLGDAQEVQQANRNTQDGMQHKGMFGLKGTLRDVLGLLGDSLLVGSGKDSVYDKVRQREVEGDAMAGFTRDPAAAAERMTGVNPEVARQLQTLAVNEQLKQAQLKSANAARESQIADRQFENVTKATNLIARIFASPVAKTRPDLAMKQAESIANRIGVPLEQLGVNPGMSSEERDMYSSMDMSVDKTMNIPFKERQLDISQQNADASTTRANRPPAGRAPPTRSLGQVDAEVADAVLSGRATPSQRQYYEERLKRAPKKGSSGRATPRPGGVAGPPPGFKLGRKIN